MQEARNHGSMETAREGEGDGEEYKGSRWRGARRLWRRWRGERGYYYLACSYCVHRFRAMACVRCKRSVPPGGESELCKRCLRKEISSATRPQHVVPVAASVAPLPTKSEERSPRARPPSSPPAASAEEGRMAREETSAAEPALVARTLQCHQCKRGFDFDVGQQVFFAARGYTAPSRCKECISARKATVKKAKVKQALKRERRKRKRGPESIDGYPTADANSSAGVCNYLGRKCPASTVS